MPDDFNKTAQYYVGKRIDKLEEKLEQQINTRFDSLEKVIDTHLTFCDATRERLSTRVGKLESFKNRALGALALFMVLLTIWKVTL